MKEAKDLEAEIEFDLERGYKAACEILDVRPEASAETMRKLALEKFKSFHPDKFSDP